jgi:hypothetical protein
VGRKVGRKARGIITLTPSDKLIAISAFHTSKERGKKTKEGRS